MRSFVFLGLLMGFLAACASAPPNDGDYWRNTTPLPSDLEAQKAEDDLRRVETQTLVPSTDTSAGTVTEAPLDGVVSGDTVTVDLAPAQTPATVPAQDGSISNSQDFQVVKANETIQSDAAKLEALKQKYEVVQPGAAPTRDTDVNLAKYALSQDHPVGQKLYSRGVLAKSREKRKCEAYSSNDEAQTDFLTAGGPKKDPLGLDANGDGYACGWTPARYRALLGG